MLRTRTSQKTKINDSSHLQSYVEYTYTVIPSSPLLQTPITPDHWTRGEEVPSGEVTVMQQLTMLSTAKSAVCWTDFTYPLTAGLVGASQMILQPVSSIFPCSVLPSGTWQTLLSTLLNWQSWQQILCCVCGFSLLARMMGEGFMNHFLPVLFFFFKAEFQVMCNNSCQQ